MYFPLPVQTELADNISCHYIWADPRKTLLEQTRFEKSEYPTVLGAHFKVRFIAVNSCLPIHVTKLQETQGARLAR